MKQIVFALIVTVLWWIFAIWYWQPVLAFGFSGWLAIAFLNGALWFFITRIGNTSAGPIHPLAIAGISLSASAMLWILIGNIGASGMFRAKAYHDLIGPIEAGADFTHDVKETRPERIVLYDEDVANTLGDKVIGTMPALGSQVTLGDFYLQNVKGKLYWVAPLLHSGFFKWLTNRSEGTPGYVMVSVNDELDVRLVTNVNGKDLKIKYQPDAYFSQNLDRHIYFSGHMTDPYTDISFEVDDEGNPFWVAVLYERTIGFGGEDVTGVMTIDPETGEISKYGLHDAPEWIDRIYSDHFLEDQVWYWGNYVNGWWNPSHQDIITPVGEMVLVYGEGDSCYWYQGMTSTGADNSTVGFVLINSRTKHAKFYNQAGATEEAAMSSAEGKVQDQGYWAGHPVAYNIYNQPTYVVPLHDQANLVKAIALVNVHDFNMVAVGSELDDALRDYQYQINHKIGQHTNDTTSIWRQVHTIVSRKSEIVRNGQTWVYLKMAADSLPLFMGDPSRFPSLGLTLPGDSVVVRYFPSMNASQPTEIGEFENKLK